MVNCVSMYLVRYSIVYISTGVVKKIFQMIYFSRLIFQMIYFRTLIFQMIYFCTLIFQMIYFCILIFQIYLYHSPNSYFLYFKDVAGFVRVTKTYYFIHQMTNIPFQVPSQLFSSTPIRPNSSRQSHP